MNFVDRAVMALSPRHGLQRLQARRAAQVFMNYELAGAGRRQTRMPRPGDADLAAARRVRASWIARDLVRNSGVAARAVSVISGAVVGDGIVPSLTGASEAAQQEFEDRARAHFDTTAVDARGVSNLYGLQKQVGQAVVTDGECLVRIRRRRSREGLAFPFQLEVLEADHLDGSRDTVLARSGGLEVRGGIEFDARGRRTAYFLFDQHPGKAGAVSITSRRVPASEIMHVYRVDRPGQSRGVTWFAPVGTKIQDLDDYMEAQLLRQKIAACFAAFRTSVDGQPPAKEADSLAKLQPGMIYSLAPGEDVRFAEPPNLSGLEDWSRAAVREVAAGLGITYEALSGDLRGVNYTSGRMGRLEMSRNVSSWQWLMLVPQMCQPIGDLVLRTMRIERSDMDGARVDWTPPPMPILDAAKEALAQRSEVRAGFRSWSDVVRSRGYDPDEVAREIAGDADRFDRLGVRVESDARMAPGAGVGDGGAAGGQPPADGGGPAPDGED